MSSGVYVIQKDDSLLEMNEKDYDSEDVLQTLLADHPSLIPGGQIDSIHPRRWLLISREASIPGEEDGGGRWSLDHLLIDQDAIPTLVEVKRSTDTRIRREVVGQMLDYAANASKYWPIETVRAQFKTTCETRGETPEQVLAGFLGEEADLEEFWDSAEANLRSGRLRLVFLADSVPTELQVIVEFLNSQMEHVEVLAVEVKQYAREGMKTLVSRVIGQTAAKKATREQRQWDENSFFKELALQRGAEEASVARRIFEWGNQKMTGIWWGKGKVMGSFVPTLDVAGTTHYLASMWTTGGAEIQFQHMAKKPPFDDEGLRLELLARLNEIPGVNIPEDAITRRPNIAFPTFFDEQALDQFLGVLDWCVEQITGT